MVSFEDSRTKKIAEVLGNKTCKKIIDVLSEEKELSEKEISEKLKLPMNTVEYNLKKLLETGFIEKSKNFFWSMKGKKIDMYRLANKHIVISPTSPKEVGSKIKKILPAVIAAGLGAFLIMIFSKPLLQGREFAAEKGADLLVRESVESAGGIAPAVGNAGIEGLSYGLLGWPIWAWFLLGALIAIIIFTIWNWSRL